MLEDIQVHPAADLFPLMEGKSFDDLVEDIRLYRQREPVALTPDGLLLDGRNRWRACEKLGWKPDTRIESSEPWAYVISTNLQRRHLTESQRAMIGARMAERANGSHRGNQYRDQVGTPPVDGASLPPTRVETAALLGIGTASIDRGRQVLQYGVKGLHQLVENGSVKVTTAARVASKMEPDEQEDYVRRVKGGANPRRLAPPDTESMRRTRTGRTPYESKTAGFATDRRADRHKYLNAAALRQLLNNLQTLEIVLKDVQGGLDPGITGEQATAWIADLSRRHAAYSSVMKMLRQRESESSE